MLVKFKDLETLKNEYNIYVDVDTDVWKNKKSHGLWDTVSVGNGNNEHVTYVVGFDVGKVVDFDDKENEHDYVYDNVKWAVEKVLTPETDPEYYL